MSTVYERYDFASDNTAGIAPEAWQALQRANQGYTPAYGRDEWTLEACNLLRQFFETDCEVFFMFNGTAANSVSLARLCHPYEGVVCHELAHLIRHECGAPVFFSGGAKMLTVGGEDAKITASVVEDVLARRDDLPLATPSVISITQPTELGTTYKLDDLQALGSVARRHGLKMHVDGARFLNAVVSLDASPAELTWKSGVDVLCLGGTKLGTLTGDAVIIFDRELAGSFDHWCKQTGQLASKMRFLAAPWVGLLKTNAWLGYAQHANACARCLARLFQDAGIEVAHPVETNAVFAYLPLNVAAHLRLRGWRFSNFLGSTYRFVCSWQTRADDIEALMTDIETAT